MAYGPHECKLIKIIFSALLCTYCSSLLMFPAFTPCICLQFMGTVVMSTVAFGVVYFVDSMGPTAAGLMLIYSLALTDHLTFLTRAQADVSPLCRWFLFMTNCVLVVVPVPPCPD